MMPCTCYNILSSIQTLTRWTKLNSASLTETPLHLPRISSASDHDDQVDLMSPVTSDAAILSRTAFLSNGNVPARLHTVVASPSEPGPEPQSAYCLSNIEQMSRISSSFVSKSVHHGTGARGKAICGDASRADRYIAANARVLWGYSAGAGVCRLNSNMACA